MTVGFNGKKNDQEKEVGEFTLVEDEVGELNWELVVKEVQDRESFYTQNCASNGAEMHCVSLMISTSQMIERCTSVCVFGLQQNSTPSNSGRCLAYQDLSKNAVHWRAETSLSRLGKLSSVLEL